MAARTVVWLLAERLVYIRNSFIPHPVKSTTGLVEGLEDLPCLAAGTQPSDPSRLRLSSAQQQTRRALAPQRPGEAAA